jgi:tetratricopeptide (TPR) repeat protein
LSGIQTVELPDQHVIEITLEDGIILYRRAEALLADPEARGTSDNTLPVALSAPSSDRGAGRYLVKLYRFFKGASVADVTVEIATKRIEGKLFAKDELLRCRTPFELSDTGQINDGAQILVLLHGTFSSTSGSFGHFAGADGGLGLPHWPRLLSAFPGPVPDSSNIFAFEHCTLSKSPLENAIRLVDNLPKGARVHLLSHSRGGLVGELLARAARIGAGSAGEYFDEVDAQIVKARYSGKVAQVVLEQLKELDAKLAERQLDLRNFVRVASPARGTLLASNRLDLYLSVMLNLFSLAPGPQQTFMPAFASFVRAIVGSRKDPRELPGLEAMMPDAALIACLNRQDVNLNAPLDIVGGDTKAGGLLRSLAVFAGDLFYREDHDFVVNTQAMFGGAQRVVKPRALIARGSDVSHFGYFRDAETLDRITDVLTGALPPSVTAPEVPAINRGATGARPTALLLPGIMGSSLSIDSELIWIDPFKIMGGGITRVGADKTGKPAAGVQALGYIERYYKTLAEHISITHRTAVMPYDWRVSVDTAADLLRIAVERELDAMEGSNQPLRLICHSMGGLVARRMIVKHRATWNRMHNGRSGSRVIMLGTPNGGSAAMAAGLVGHDKMIQQLALADFTNNLQEVLAALTPLPGLLELLPTDNNFAYFEPGAWEKLAAIAPKGWSAPPAAALSAAKRFWQDMALLPDDVRHITYVAGQAPLTLVGFRDTDLAILATPNGDGRVPWSTGLLPGVRTWYAAGVSHGDLTRDRRLFPAIADLLHDGTTNRLPQTPPTTRGVEATFEVTEEPVLYPSGEDFDLIVMGGTPDAELIERGGAPKAKVSIEHGDLRLQPGTVAVGHYHGAPLLSAERELDRTLGGVLVRHRDAGIYPGNVGTSDFFVDEDLSRVGPDAALVVGLGPFGSLTPRDLQAAMTEAFTRFALKSGGGPAEERALSSLLIGHRDSRISLAESVRAILNALVDANRQVPERLRIGQLTILELFEDRAIEASEALADFAKDQRFDTLTVDARLRDGRAGRQRQSYGRDDGWDMIIEITCDDAVDSKKLRFKVMNRSALIDSKGMEIDSAAMDHLIDGVQSSRLINVDTGKLLFRRMIPRAVRQVLSEGSNVTLVLDATTARYPWELCVDSSGVLPIAVRTRMIRQLVHTRTSDRPRAITSDVALVVANPKSQYSDLPQAREEGSIVAGKIEASGIAKLVEAFDDDPRTEKKIYLSDPRIFHFAGHGVLNGGPNSDTIGLVIGRNSFLKASDIEEMDTVPEFVFLNCCHVGRISPDALDAKGDPANVPEIWVSRSKLAANIAVAFMKQGSKAVIAAGWAIDDTQAKIFSQVFYDQFLEGETFGNAVTKAREKTYEAAENDPTWGAYQCYGDPDYQLRTREGIAPKSSRPVVYYARAKVLADLWAIGADARFAMGEADAIQLFEKVHGIRASVEENPDWAMDPLVLEALGRALAEIGYRKEAIPILAKAARASPPTITLDSIELLSTLRVRAASDASLKAPQNSDLRKKEIRTHLDAIQTLKNHSLDANASNDAANGEVWLGTIDRTLHLGDTYLRYAAALASSRPYKDYREMLDNAVEAYGWAEDQTAPGDALSLSYARLRKAAAEFFLQRDKKQTGLDLMPVVDSVIASLRVDKAARPMFERELRLAEAQLLLLLIEGAGPDPRYEDSVASFMRAFYAGATIGQREETISDLEALARLLSRDKASGTAAAEHVHLITSELRLRSLPRQSNPTSGDQI